jgi:hypothetical protein
LYLVLQEREHTTASPRAAEVEFCSSDYINVIGSGFGEFGGRSQHVALHLWR